MHGSALSLKADERAGLPSTCSSLAPPTARAAVRSQCGNGGVMWRAVAYDPFMLLLESHSIRGTQR
jgi:hypothetical protein